jgi:hypothetical protein
MAESLFQSSSPNMVKVFQFNTGSVPRTPLSTGPLSKFFPSASTIPQPLTAAMAAYIPARVYFFGGTAGSRQVAMYSFNTMTTTFIPLGFSTTLANAWPTDIKAATMYYYPNNGSTGLYTFDTSSTAQVNANLAVSIFLGIILVYIETEFMSFDSQILNGNGPSSVASCVKWLPIVLSPTCCILTTTSSATTASTSAASTSISTLTSTPSTTTVRTNTIIQLKLVY